MSLFDRVLRPMHTQQAGRAGDKARAVDDHGFVTHPSDGANSRADAGMTSPIRTPGQTITVRRGDTLHTLAERAYADQDQWEWIIRRNPDVDWRTVNIGSVLVI